MEGNLPVGIRDSGTWRERLRKVQQWNATPTRGSFESECGRIELSLLQNLNDQTSEVH